MSSNHTIILNHTNITYIYSCIIKYAHSNISHIQYTQIRLLGYF